MVILNSSVSNFTSLAPDSATNFIKSCIFFNSILTIIKLVFIYPKVLQRSLKVEFSPKEHQKMLSYFLKTLYKNKAFCFQIVLIFNSIKNYSKKQNFLRFFSMRS